MIPYFNLDAPLIRTNFGEEFLDIVQDEEEEEEKYQLFEEEEEKEHLIKEEKIRNIYEDKEPIDKSLVPPFVSHLNEKDKDSLEKNFNRKNKMNKLVDNQKNILKKKRGRKRTKNLGKGVHGKNDFDNLQRKIQVHFQKFLINFCNDALVTEDRDFTFFFKQINYKSKMVVNFKHISKLKQSSIKDILLEEKISPKFSTYKYDENKEILSIIKSSWLNKLFQMNYLKLFNLYYNNEKPLDKITFENKEIILSKKTKSFYDLLVKNPDFRINIIDTTKIVFLNDYVKKPFFITIRKMEEKDEFCK